MRRSLILVVLVPVFALAQTKPLKPPAPKARNGYGGKPDPAVAKAIEEAKAKAPQQAGGNNGGIIFTDVSKEVGLKWTHVNGAKGDKYFIETMGGGGAFLDYNKDGLLDILLINSGCHKFSGPKCAPGKSALYRQDPGGTFTDVTAESGLNAITGFGMGATVGDYDNDGYPDIYVTAFGHNQLFHNNRNGTFTDVTAKAGVAASGWSTSAAFFDYNHDGLPDLFVGRYLDWDYSKHIYCGETRPGYRSYCHPNEYKEVTSILYRNNGDGTFTDVTAAAHVDDPGKALGVVVFDFDRDGWLDIYVANDAVRNQLYRNNGDGTFTESGMITEVAYGSGGKPRSGMGTDAADVTGDGYPELFVTNLDYEPNTYFINNADGSFTDQTVVANLGSVALLYSGFGTRFLDYNNDGLLDIAVFNGHPVDNIQLFHDGVTGSERPLLLENKGTTFEEVGRLHGDVWDRKFNGRGMAVGDFDNDGDPDLLFIPNGQPAALIRNDGGNAQPWIGFELVGSKASSRDAIGAVVTIIVGGKKQVRELVGGASYLSAHDLRLLFGLGKLLPDKQTAVDSVQVKWPDGRTTTYSNLAVRKYHKLSEPEK